MNRSCSKNEKQASVFFVLRQILWQRATQRVAPKGHVPCYGDKISSCLPFREHQMDE